MPREGACILLVALVTSPNVGRVYSVTIEVTATYITVLLCHVFVLVSVECADSGYLERPGGTRGPGAGMVSSNSPRDNRMHSGGLHCKEILGGI